MTAHVIYNALDKNNPVTVSKAAIKYIREVMGYNGVLISDALEMQALVGPVEERFEKAIIAGCDLGLYCAGDFADMKLLAAKVKKVDAILEEKIASFNSYIKFNDKLLEYVPNLERMFNDKIAQ